MPSMPFRVTQTGVSTTAGYTATFFPDYYVRPFSIGIGCVVSSTAVTYSVQHTFDDITSSTFVSTAANWFYNTSFSSAAASADGSYTYPVSAIRLITTAGSSIGTVQMTCIQAG